MDEMRQDLGALTLLKNAGVPGGPSSIFGSIQSLRDGAYRRQLALDLGLACHLGEPVRRSDRGSTDRRGSAGAPCASDEVAIGQLSETMGRMLIGLENRPLGSCHCRRRSDAKRKAEGAAFATIVGRRIGFRRLMLVVLELGVMVVTDMYVEVD